jgi:hypothetical protein
MTRTARMTETGNSAGMKETAQLLRSPAKCRAPTDRSEEKRATRDFLVEPPFEMPMGKSL